MARFLLCVHRALNILLWGAQPEEQLRNYRALFTYHVDGLLLDQIRSNSNQGMAIGNGWIKEEMESQSRRRLRTKKRE